MNITRIVSLTPINPAHGRHEVHAKTAEGIDVGFQISPEALGLLAAYFDFYPQTDEAYAAYQKQMKKPAAASPKKKGS